MRKNLSNLFWGVLLIAGGLLALAQSLGYLPELNPSVWTIVFAVISLLSLAVYFRSGVQNWGILFPAGIFGGLAVTIWLAGAQNENPAMAAPLFVGIGLPFVVAYALDRSRHWWALIPAGIMVFLTFVLLVVDNFRGEVIGAGLFFILACSFGLVYLTRRAMWAALVAYIMFVMGFLPLLAMGDRPELAGVLVLFAIALPFFFVYFQSPDERWWALIPAGILATTGILTAFVLVPGLPEPGYDNRIPNAILSFGIAATFAVLWLRHHKPWGAVVAVLSSLAGVGSLIFGGLEKSWPVFIILAGVYLLYQGTRSKKAW